MDLYSSDHIIYYQFFHTNNSGFLKILRYWHMLRAHTLYNSTFCSYKNNYFTKTIIWLKYMISDILHIWGKKYSLYSSEGCPKQHRVFVTRVYVRACNVQRRDAAMNGLRFMPTPCLDHVALEPLESSGESLIRGEVISCLCERGGRMKGTDNVQQRTIHQLAAWVNKRCPARSPVPSLTRFSA